MENTKEIDRLRKYDAVNSCESLSELAQIIRNFADEDGMIQGRSKKFNAEMMAKYCEIFDQVPPQMLTREYGIRQQALMLK